MQILSELRDVLHIFWWSERVSTLSQSLESTMSDHLVQILSVPNWEKWDNLHIFWWSEGVSTLRGSLEPNDFPVALALIVVNAWAACWSSSRWVRGLSVPLHSNNLIISSRTGCCTSRWSGNSAEIILRSHCAAGYPRVSQVRCQGREVAHQSFLFLLLQQIFSPSSFEVSSSHFPLKGPFVFNTPFTLLCHKIPYLAIL